MRNATRIMLLVATAALMNLEAGVSPWIAGFVTALAAAEVSRAVIERKVR